MLNQLKPISTSQMRGLQTTRPVILLIILLAWIRLPVVARPPDSLKTRGFMYSGAPRVVASLWNVDDLATAELMKLFYQRMLKDGLPAGAALRAAQIELSRQKRWASPYFWAGFVLHGEWK